MLMKVTAPAGRFTKRTWPKLLIVSWRTTLPFMTCAVITVSTGRYPAGIVNRADVPDTLQVLWEFPEKQMTMTWNMMQANPFNFGVGSPSPGRHNGIVFHGKAGTLTIVNYGTQMLVVHPVNTRSRTPIRCRVS